MRVSVVITLVAALLALAAVLLVGQALLQPDLPLITAAGFSTETITPNADGDGDVAEFSYTLTSNAQVTLAFEAQDGTVYYFRQDEPRTPGEKRVLFSGVVDGFTLDGETVSGQVLRRLIPNGSYTWRLTATDTASGETMEQSGTLVIADGESQLPEIISFTVSPDVFTPNQDGIADRTQINVYLPKAAELAVYLEGPDGQQIYVPERDEGRALGEPGRHLFDYDGGIDLGVQPPPDGTYTVVAVAQDDEGQRVQQTATLLVQGGGDPQAEIAPQASGADVAFAVVPYEERYFTSADVQGDLVALPDDPQDLGFSSITMPVGDLLVFRLTVENYGSVPIRTSGPGPGTVYEQDQVWGAMGVYEESGAWRVGLNCSTSTRDFPWRWAVGTPENLQAVVDEVSGKTYYYLMPGTQSVVWGAVRMTNLIEARNPQQCWAGLIHEDVEVSVRNARVGARDIELIPQSGE
ncbi:MAG: hypothetical protein JNJ61_26420 [Anaerolineae bacterium]|nr:hypothetical protein [Anaerolineae bacterium]